MTAAEEANIQAIAKKYATSIDVVGSRAAGKGRNIGSSLPVGKGRWTRSDIDFRIDGNHSEVDSLIAELRAVSNGAGRASLKYTTNARPTRAPYIRFD